MEYNEFKKEFDTNLNRINVVCNDDSSKKIYLYMKNLLEWNEKINLTAIKDEKEIILKHFVDSLYLANQVKGKILDIGSGAGFPGLALATVNEELQVISIDSVNKKINFQTDTIEKLKLKNATAIHVRAEELAMKKEYREQFDFVVSRAVANMTTLVEYALPFVKKGGLCVCLKGPNYKEEVDEAKKAIKILGGRIEKIEEYKIEKDVARTCIYIRKESNTPMKYPRGQGKPLKDPIK